MDRTSLLPDVVERAIRFASMAHRRQRRKGSELPYIAHPAAVAEVLRNAGFDRPSLLAAAWLHDVVEDTPVTLAELAEVFPEEVVTVVDLMSEHKTDEQGTVLPWRERKARHLARMRTAPEAALAVMLADKLHNLISMRDDARGRPDFWDRFNAPRDELLGYYADMVSLARDFETLSKLRAACECELQACHDVPGGDVPAETEDESAGR